MFKIKRMGVVVSERNNKSTTIRFFSKYNMDRAKKMMKYQSVIKTYSSGYPLTLNFDK